MQDSAQYCSSRVYYLLITGVLQSVGSLLSWVYLTGQHLRCCWALGLPICGLPDLLWFVFVLIKLCSSTEESALVWRHKERKHPTPCLLHYISWHYSRSHRNLPGLYSTCLGAEGVFLTAAPCACIHFTLLNQVAVVELSLCFYCFIHCGVRNTEKPAISASRWLAGEKVYMCDSEKQQYVEHRLMFSISEVDHLCFM